MMAHYIHAVQLFGVVLMAGAVLMGIIASRRVR